jgi:tetratricopeptide (TPR) repeat protein
VVIQQQNMQPVTPTQSSEDWFEQGNKLLFKYAKRAFQELNQVLGVGKQQNIQPVSEDWFEQGNQLVNLQRYAEAVKAYDRAIIINPNDHVSWYNRSVALYSLPEGGTNKAESKAM